MHTGEMLRRRGYHAAYVEGEVNHCPGCGKTHWLIGRISAECAFCSTALPLAASSAPLSFVLPRAPQIGLAA